jgi:hypothetical protein
MRMVLKRGDIACFIANWQDKAQNIRTIARQLNIELDSLVFFDDNHAEENNACRTSSVCHAMFWRRGRYFHGIDSWERITALNLLPPIATMARVNRPSWRHSSTN